MSEETAQRETKEALCSASSGQGGQIIPCMNTYLLSSRPGILNTNSALLYQVMQALALACIWLKYGAQGKVWGRLAYRGVHAGYDGRIRVQFQAEFPSSCVSVSAEAESGVWSLESGEGGERKER